MPIQGYTDLQCIIPFFFQSESDAELQRAKIWMVSFKYDPDVSDLFPYINGALDDAVFYEQPEHVRFLLDGYRCLVYPHMAIACYFENRAEAEVIVAHLIRFLNHIEERKESLVPNHSRLKRIPVLHILKLLPKTNCRQCGYATCMAFAAGVFQDRVSIEKCPHLTLPISETAVYPVFNHRGDIEDTIRLPISTAVMKETIQTQQHRIAMLEAALHDRPPEAGAPSASVDEAAPLQDYGLTRRETEVLRLIAEGHTNNEISGLLFVSPHTVKSHMINIFNKMNVSDRTRAAVLATRAQLI